MNESDKEEQEKVIQFLNVFNRPLRRKLKEMGVSIEDSNSGTKWRVD